MRAVIQRVKKAEVRVEGDVVGKIGFGLLVLLGVTHGDDEKDAEYLARKIAGLRIFNDEECRMNHSIVDIGGGVLVVSQFTLYGDTKKGRRPSYVDAAPPDLAQTLYRRFVELLRQQGIPTEEGVFGARMEVELINWGPVTLIIESPNRG